MKNTFQPSFRKNLGKLSIKTFGRRNGLKLRPPQPQTQVLNLRLQPQNFSLRPNTAIYQFLNPETNKANFRLFWELFEKIYRGRYHSEISKTNKKIMKSSQWTCPQGCQNMSYNPLNKLMEIWCANFEPKLQKI